MSGSYIPPSSGGGGGATTHDELSDKNTPTPQHTIAAIDTLETRLTTTTTYWFTDADLTAGEMSLDTGIINAGTHIGFDFTIPAIVTLWMGNQLVNPTTFLNAGDLASTVTLKAAGGTHAISTPDLPYGEDELVLLNGERTTLVYLNSVAGASGPEWEDGNWYVVSGKGATVAPTPTDGALQIFKRNQFI